MPPTMTCYACEKEPTQQCPRCGRPYCEEHGEDFCGVCLEPASGVPSFNLYRGSLLALIVGAVLALWLIIEPTGGSGDSGPKPIVLTPTSSAAAARASTTVPGTTAPGAGTAPAGTSPSPATTGTARPSGTVTATGTVRPATTGTVSTGSTPSTGSGDYVVVSGDTLTGICETKIRKPAGMTTIECVDRIKALNSLTSDNISIGQTLKVPQ